MDPSAPEKLPGAAPSEQRFPTSVADADTLAAHYFDWLRSVTWGLVRARAEGAGALTIRVLGIPLIRLSPQPTDTPSRREFGIFGGLLARPGGSFGFALGDGEAVVTLRGYRSSYPAALYRWTQGPLHKLVMAHYSASWRARTSS